MSILISFANLLLYIAIIIFVAFAIRWLIQGFMGWSIDGNVYKWGQIIVGLLCIIAILVWLSGLLGEVRRLAALLGTISNRSSMRCRPPVRHRHRSAGDVNFSGSI